MGVFTVDDALRAAAIDAGHELGLFEALGAPLTLAQLAERIGVRPTHRLAALVDAVVALGALAIVGPSSAIVRTSRGVDADSRIARGTIAPRSAQPLVDGWGAIASVIRTDTPLAIVDADIARRYQRHLVTASAPAAREVAALLVAMPRLASACPPAGQEIDEGGGPGNPSCVVRPDAFANVVSRSASVGIATREALRAVDIGSGAGAYSRALLVADPHAQATLVDEAAVIELARAELAEFADRTRFVEGDARDLELGAGRDHDNACARDAGDAHDPAEDERATGAGFDLAIVANVLHLHSPAACAQLCATAARAVHPGGVVAVVDLRRGTTEGELFALNMAVYTDGGSVYSVEQIGAWLREAGLGAIEERRLESAPEMVVVLARREIAHDDTSAELG